MEALITTYFNQVKTNLDIGIKYIKLKIGL